MNDIEKQRDHTIDLDMKNVYKYDNEIEKLCKKELPLREYDSNRVIRKCEIEFFDSKKNQIRYISEVLDKYEMVLCKLNDLLKKRMATLDEINIELQKSGHTPYAPGGGKGFNIRENVFREYGKLKGKLNEMTKENDIYSKYKPVEKIHWTGTEYQLIKHFEHLQKAGYVKVSEKRKYEIIAQHFKNKDGNDFKPKQMSVVAQEQFLDEGSVAHLVSQLKQDPSK